MISLFLWRMPGYTAVLSPGTDIFRIKGKKMTNLTWESLYYKQGLIFFDAESQLLKLGLLIFSILLFYYILLYITYITVLLKVVGRFYFPWFWWSENTCFLPIEILHIPFLSISCLVYVNRIIVSQVSPLLRKSWVHSQIPNNQSYRV